MTPGQDAGPCRWRKVIIWGAASIGEACLALLAERDVEVLHFVDMRPPKGGSFRGVPVHGGAAFLEDPDTAQQADAIIFAMRSDSRELRDRLRERSYAGEFATFHGGTAAELFDQPHPLTAQAPCFVGLADQEALSSQDLKRALEAAGWVRSLLDQRSGRIRELGLDEATWMPAANWEAGRTFHELAFRILAGGAEDLGILRILSLHFSGAALMSMSKSAGVGLPPKARDLLEARLRTLTLDHHIHSMFRRLQAELPSHLRVGPPGKLGEIGWRLDGVIVNYDLIAYWERLLMLYRFGFLDRDSPRALKRSMRVLEIGGGYGGLAWHLQEAVPGLSYSILDLPESLAFSTSYLEVLHPGATRFLANYQFQELLQDGEEFDLVINTLSMSEMSEAQVRAYCRGIPALIRNGGAFFEQNQDNLQLGMVNAMAIIADYLELDMQEGGQPHGFPNVWKARKA